MGGPGTRCDALDPSRLVEPGTRFSCPDAKLLFLFFQLFCFSQPFPPRNGGPAPPNGAKHETLGRRLQFQAQAICTPRSLHDSPADLAVHRLAPSARPGLVWRCGRLRTVLVLARHHTHTYSVTHPHAPTPPPSQASDCLRPPPTVCLTPIDRAGHGVAATQPHPAFCVVVASFTHRRTSASARSSAPVAHRRPLAPRLAPRR